VDLDHPRLTDLVGELTVKSPEFAPLWGRHEVRVKTSGGKHLVYPVVGKISLGYETFTVNAAQGQSLTVYHAAPGSPDADKLALLASHAATSAGAVSGVILFQDHSERVLVSPDPSPMRLPWS
jgi:hypothetical protein